MSIVFHNILKRLEVPNRIFIMCPLLTWMICRLFDELEIRLVKQEVSLHTLLHHALNHCQLLVITCNCCFSCKQIGVDNFFFTLLLIQNMYFMRWCIYPTYLKYKKTDKERDHAKSDFHFHCTNKIIQRFNSDTCESYLPLGLRPA